MAACWSEWRPILVMLAVDAVFAIVNSMIKKAIDDGLNSLVLVTLRQLVATLVLAPIAFFYERKMRPKMTLEIFVYLFFSALLGASLTQYLFYMGLQYTTATVACAFINLTPVFTFLISLALRMEPLNLKSKPGTAKAVGTLVCLVGAAVVTFYKGAPLDNNARYRSEIAPPPGDADFSSSSSSSSRKWVSGSIVLIATCVCWSSWFPLQSRVAKKYPTIYSCTALVFFLSFLQAAALGLAAQRARGLSIWILKKKLEIATVLLSGGLGSGACFLAMSWCVAQRGPVFTAAFTPLVQVIVAGIDFSVLHEQIYLGSVMGSILVIGGLYSVLWGKKMEADRASVDIAATKPAGEGKGVPTSSLNPEIEEDGI